MRVHRELNPHGVRGATCAQTRRDRLRTQDSLTCPPVGSPPERVSSKTAIRSSIPARSGWLVAIDCSRTVYARSWIALECSTIVRRPPPYRTGPVRRSRRPLAEREVSAGWGRFVVPSSTCRSGRASHPTRRSSSRWPDSPRRSRTAHRPRSTIPSLVQGLPPSPDTSVLALGHDGQPVGAAWWHFRKPPLVMTPDGAPVLAAMEPSLVGREDDQRDGPDGRLRVFAAMEPSLVGREDIGSIAAYVGLTPAAMEPSLVGREDG